jgi:hypothetical protein
MEEAQNGKLCEHWLAVPINDRFAVVGLGMGRPFPGLNMRKYFGMSTCVPEGRGRSSLLTW